MNKFSENIVNQRFKKVFETLERINIIKGKSDIAKQLGTYNHVVNSILKGQRNVTVEQLNKLFEIYGINANYVFGNSDQMFLESRLPEGDFPTFNLKNRPAKVRQNITLVPHKVLAGYALEHQASDYLDSLQKFGIPGMQGSNLIAFEITGDSMYPTITNGDYVVCEEVKREEPIRDNHVYVIVTEVVVAKRIQQIRDEEGEIYQLRLISDNDMVYKPYEIDLEEIKQILKVKCRVTDYAIG